LVLFVLGSLTTIHFLFIFKGTNPSGIFLIIDHLYTMIVAFTLLFIFLILGSYTLTRCGIIFNQPLEGFLFSIAIGGCLVASGLLLLGVLGGFHKLILFPFLLFCAFIARKHLGNTILLIKKSIYCLRENAHFLSLLIFGLAAAFLICMALAPPTDSDSLRLHLRVPAQFLQKGVIYLPEDNLAISFVQLAHMWYVPLLAFGGVAGPALFNTFFALALCLATFSFGLRFLNPQTATLSLACFWANTVILLVAITARVDVTLAFILFLGHYALLKALNDPSKIRLFLLSAILLGFGAGIKYNAIFYILALCPLIVWVFILGVRNYSWSVKQLLIFGSLVVIAASPWMIKNIFQFHAPLYPFFTERQVEPWLNNFYLDSSPLSSIIKSEIADSIQQMANPFNLIEYIRSPGKLMVEWEGHFYTFNVIFLVIPLWLLFLKNKILNFLIVPNILFILMVVAFWPFSNIRYLIPAMISLTIVGCHIIIEIRGKIFKDLLRRKIYLYLFIYIVMISPTIAMYYWPYNKMALKYFSGLISEENYFRAKSMPTSLYADMVFYVNNNLGGKNKILMIFESRGFYFRVPVIQDNELSNWPLLAQKNITSIDLRSAGISHVLVNTYEPIGLRSRGMNVKALRLDEFKVFEMKYLVPVYKNDGYVLYSVLAHITQL